MTQSNGLDRRRVLQLGALAATAAGGLPLVAGCGDEVEAVKPQELALLRIGAADAINSSGLDPRSAGAGASIIVMRHVYDSLMILEETEFKLSLAESVQPNADATKWTVRIRDGVKFHDGRPVRAADVAYSIKQLATPPSNRASVYADVDVANLKVIDDRTVEVPLKKPRGDFREGILVVYSVIFPDGTTDFTKAIGSGPYKLDKADERAVRLVSAGEHWSGKPTLKELEIIRIKDAAARLSAVKDGQIDYAVGVSPAGAHAERANAALEIHRGGVANSNALSFAMNQKLAPFDDPRVRRAVRLAADRQSLIETALMGLGTPGDDVVGKGLPGYAKGIEARKRDLATAKALFAEAGVTQLTIRAADVVPGMLTAAKLFAQQLAEAGVTLNIQQVPTESYYADLKALATYPFQVFYYSNRPAAVHLASTTTATATFNVTGTGPQWWQRLAEAQASADDAKRAAAFAELQKEFYESGGDLLWGFQEAVDISRAGIGGVKVLQSTPIFTGAVAV